MRPTRDETALLDACYTGDAETVRSSLAGGVSPETRDEDGHAALHLAAMNGSSDVIRLLLDAGAAVNGSRDQEAEAHGVALANPLYYAAGSGHLEVVEPSFSRGADLDSVSPMGVTPLMLAAEEGHASIVAFLVQAGANLALTDGDRMTALHHAAVGGNARIVAALLEAGSDVNALARFGSTPLDIARRVHGEEHSTVGVLEARGGRESR